MSKMTSDINYILEAIDRNIAEQEQIEEETLAVLESTADPDKFKAADLRFNSSVFVAGYLSNFKRDIKPEQDISSVECTIRNLAEYLHVEAKSNKNREPSITLGISIVADILDGYISRFFTAPSKSNQ